MISKSFPPLDENFTEKLLAPESILIPDLLRTHIQPNQLLVAELSACLRHSQSLPPIDVFHDGQNYWLAKNLELLLAIQTVQSTPIHAQSVHAKVRTGSDRQAALNLIKTRVSPRSARKRNGEALIKQLLTEPDWGQSIKPELAQINA
jgi:hypothetical protein